MNTTINNLIFPELPYSFNALEPNIDAMTMEIHFTKHHRAYFDNLQNATKDTELAESSFMEVLANISQHSVAVRNNGGGHFNHSLYNPIYIKSI